MSAGYTGPACQSGNHAGCPAFWPAKFGAKGRGTACACSCHGEQDRCLWPACSRPLPCPVHSNPPGSRGGMPMTFNPLPPDAVFGPRSRPGGGGGGGAGLGAPPFAGSYSFSRPAPAPAWEDEDEEFVDAPIEDYDDLRPAEIMRALGDLDLDDLDAVREYEEQGRNRLAVLRAVDQRIAELEGGDAAPGESRPAAAEEEGLEVEDEDDDQEEDEAAGSLLDEYDSLSVFEIMGMLVDLDDDELERVAELEEQGRNRAGILDRVDAILAARERHASASPGGDDAGGEPEGADEPAGSPGEAGGEIDGPDLSAGGLDEEAAADLPVGDDLAIEDELPMEDELPIEDYDRLTAKAVIALLGELEYEELEAVRAREEQGRNRKSVIRAIEKELAQFVLLEDLEADLAAASASGQESEPQDAQPVEDGAAPAVHVPAELDGEGARPEELAGPGSDQAGDGDQAGEPEPSPIDGYDELSVFEILRLLPELSPDELERVAELEEQGRNRAAILDRVDALLGD